MIMQSVTIDINNKSKDLIKDILLNQIRFENKISIEKRKDNGIFFTNSQNIINYIISIVDFNNDIYFKKY